MDSIQLRNIREELLARRQVLIRRIAEIRNDLSDPIGRPVRDSGDQILAYNKRNLLLSQIARLGSNLQFVEDALRRMKDGIYGQCSECGKPIETKRLVVVPWTGLCVECQTQKEGSSSSHFGKSGIEFSKNSHILMRGIAGSKINLHQATLHATLSNTRN